MNIEEYADELRLIKKQYGQEEDLYFIINALIRQSLPKHMTVRDIHNAQKADNTAFPAREHFRKYGQAPDLVILDKEFDQTKESGQGKYVYGCVEIKNFIKAERNGKRIIIINKIKENTEKFIKHSDVLLPIKSRKLKKAVTESIKSGETAFKTDFSIKRIRKIRMSKDKKLTSDVEYKVINGQEKEEKLLKQIVKEIKGYRRVIYTDGLEWVYFELLKDKESKEEKIRVQVLCEFTEDIIKAEKINEKDRKSFEKLGERLEMIFRQHRTTTA